MKKLFTVLSFIIFIITFLNAQSLDEIIKKNIAVKGGAEKLNSIKTVQIEGKMIRMGMEMKISMKYKKPSMIIMEINISDKKIILGYDGKTAWQISPFTGIDGPQEMTGEQADQIIENLDMFEDPFLDYKKKGNKIEFIGKDDLEGTEVFKLKLTKKDGRIVVFFLDSDSFIELKTEMIKKKKDGKETVFESYMGDYKQVNGMMIAHSIKIKVNGIDMGNMIIESIKFNQPLESNLFKMPKKKQVKKK